MTRSSHEGWQIVTGAEGNECFSGVGVSALPLKKIGGNSRNSLYLKLLFMTRFLNWTEKKKAAYVTF